MEKIINQPNVVFVHSLMIFDILQKWVSDNLLVDTKRKHESIKNIPICRQWGCRHRLLEMIPQLLYGSNSYDRRSCKWSTVKSSRARSYTRYRDLPLSKLDNATEKNYEECKRVSLIEELWSQLMYGMVPYISHHLHSVECPISIAIIRTSSYWIPNTPRQVRTFDKRMID
jgi:hypothetical protein